MKTGKVIKSLKKKIAQIIDALFVPEPQPQLAHARARRRKPAARSRR